MNKDTLNYSPVLLNKVKINYSPSIIFSWTILHSFQTANLPVIIQSTKKLANSIRIINGYYHNFVIFTVKENLNIYIYLRLFHYCNYKNSTII